MKKTDPAFSTDRIRSWANSKAHGPSPLSNSSSPTLPLSTQPSIIADANHDSTSKPPSPPFTSRPGLGGQSSKPTSNHAADNISTDQPPPAPPPQVNSEGAVVNSEKPAKKNVATRFWLTAKGIILSSYINVLLVFVPVGIASKAAGLSPGLVFGMNAVAIVPLAGLLSHATESVAKRMGDTVGALMNVTFGNAVELIIFIALVKNEIRIVQASLLGSILANLLLILGMSFLVGGMRFREQLYNSTVTQMSACLLSLSVMSLLLPTAFHASFSTLQATKATSAVLKVSRGTSVILLVVYGMYLLFQLKSHAYMYESTPQHIIDEESAPGPVAHWMESSSDDSSSSSSSDSDTSSGSNTTAKRIRRVMRGGRRHRKSSFGSKDTAEGVIATRTPSLGNSSTSPTELISEEHHQLDHGEEGDDEANRRSRKNSVTHLTRKERKKVKKEKKRLEHQEHLERKERRRAKRNGDDTIKEDGAEPTVNEKSAVDGPRRVDFAVVEPLPTTADSQRRFNLRNMRPNIPKTFSQNVFTQPSPQASITPSGPIPRVRYGIRRTNSLPDRLNQSVPSPLPTSLTPTHVNSLALSAAKESHEDDENISRTTAIMLLLISTGLVAVCAEFMVDSINAVVDSNAGLSEAFIGLIILPIVGNAAEHVTAVTVAAKNKMDLAIGVAVGSSIQIALFVTPFVVLLGWAMSREMSLYFNLFETVSLFVSAFIVNFLVLDGRSNYLEGALLCAAYVIIAVAAFFYPNLNDQSTLGGNADAGVGNVTAAAVVVVRGLVFGA